MKRAYVSLSILSMLVLALVLAGCEESIEEGVGNGYIEIHIDTADINSEKYYYYRGRNTSDNTYFSSESRTGAAIITNLGDFISPLLNAGNWECDVYELTQHYTSSEAPSSSIVTQQSLGNSALVERDATTRITIELVPLT